MHEWVGVPWGVVGALEAFEQLKHTAYLYSLFIELNPGYSNI